MTIVTLYEAGHSDGYKIQGDGLYYLTESESRISSELRHDSYAGIITHNKVGLVDGNYYLLQSVKPITIADSKEEKEQLRQAALKKLSKYEREVLGINDSFNETNRNGL